MNLFDMQAKYADVIGTDEVLRRFAAVAAATDSSAAAG
jgi:hypothetical protein